LKTKSNCWSLGLLATRVGSTAKPFSAILTGLTTWTPNYNITHPYSNTKISGFASFLPEPTVQINQDKPTHPDIAARVRRWGIWVGRLQA
jgi:hypothetical protein